MWKLIVGFLVFAALALGTAWLAWRYIEEPARHWSRRFARERT
jgi:peptidoglycan/LPS O-acetylase OafA/YrhL